MLFLFFRKDKITQRTFLSCLYLKWPIRANSFCICKLIHMICRPFSFYTIMDMNNQLLPCLNIPGFLCNIWKALLTSDSWTQGLYKSNACTVFIWLQIKMNVRVIHVWMVVHAKMRRIIIIVHVLQDTREVPAI